MNQQDLEYGILYRDEKRFYYVGRTEPEEGDLERELDFLKSSGFKDIRVFKGPGSSEAVKELYFKLTYLPDRFG